MKGYPFMFQGVNIDEGDSIFFEGLTIKRHQGGVYIARNSTFKALLKNGNRILKSGDTEIVLDDNYFVEAVGIKKV